MERPKYIISSINDGWYVEGYGGWFRSYAEAFIETARIAADAGAYSASTLDFSVPVDDYYSYLADYDEILALEGKL